MLALHQQPIEQLCDNFSVRRGARLANGELTAREAERVMWDVIVVGTGMGGGMLGHQLAKSGRKVLFVEKGRSTLPGTPGTIRAAMPELAEPRAGRSPDAYFDALARAGRSTDEIEDISGRFPHRFVPFIGSGTGGSSALYGMVCERFFAGDFTPRQNFRNPGDSTVPEAWPITYDQMRPWYAQADCWGYVASPIRCARKPPRSICLLRRHFQQTISRWSNILRLADCTPITCRWPAITPRVVPPVRPTCARSRAKTTAAAMVCCPPLPSMAPTCWTNVGCCAWKPTAPRCGR